MQALGLVWGQLDPVNANLKEIRTPLAEPTQFGAKLLVEHWQARKATSMGFVVGRDVPSRILAPILRSLALYEPVDGMKDFRMRLAGTAFMRRFGRDVTGMKLSAIYDAESFEAQRQSLSEVIETGSPYISDVKVTRDDRIYLRFESLRLPVLSPDRKETWVMGGLFYSDWA